MNSKTFFIARGHVIRRAYRGIVFGGMVIGMCTLLFIGKAHAVVDVDFSNATATPYSAPTPAAATPISQDVISTIAPPAAAPAPAANSIYVTRYLPDILQGAQGPADMVFLIYKYLMGLVGIVAVGVIMYGGVLRTMSADPSKIRQSNDYIKNALKGIVLLFGAQVLFNTINPNIVDIDRIQRTLQPSKRIVTEPITNTEVGFEESGGLAPGGGGFGGGGAASRGGGGTVEAAAARSRLSSVGGVTLSPECAPGGSTRGCISLEGVQGGTLDSIAAMAASGIPVRITSVTEGQHASGDYSHANGYKWDMAAIDPKFFADRPDQFEKIATRSDSSATYRDKRTDAECSLERSRTYRNEKNELITVVPHWDCSAKPGGSW
ncbi:hypothetical protein A2524_04155 [Candidatus Wolfebacteria bacterium RIFOXYD12_FULL_48_21]|uniref:Uncharacterized protein n=1 Tax=Candidatus Wolfebacteria bacterium RIFOXYD1_FULL_48_65 TaxID=1802561 RepID=A0A1F8E287_9BACT|nr:MAG: hypothetical protein A2610_01790 [Candidatus Wolfebacteria bacterium RIFOXYD1_FULL_48_65]OGM95377.1 MAG: hypothetical protein A2524_04155 [Candidatus Wolfebacteria bacterium RIFOXYD12_FULL_48_21]OGM97012.1 MAG: hypothetical protein A2532_00650 [Candidatus Wolfebacteria bacterium RIFOXYD2_FULL_48_11]